MPVSDPDVSSMYPSACLFLLLKSGPNQNGEVYTDNMSQESVIIMAIIGIIVTIIGTGIGLAAILVPGQRALRKDIAALGESTRKDIAALGERVGKVELGLVDRIGKLETALVERIARLEVATEGFIKPQSTPQ